MMIRWKYLTFLLEKIYGIHVYMWDSSTLTPTNNLTLVKCSPQLKKVVLVECRNTDMALIIWWNMVVDHSTHYLAGMCSVPMFIKRPSLRDPCP